MKNKISFTIDKKEDTIIGLTFKGDSIRGVSDSLITGQTLGKGVINISGGWIELHLGKFEDGSDYHAAETHDGDIISLKLSPEDEEALKPILNLTGEYEGKKIVIRKAEDNGFGLSLRVE